MSDTRTKTPPVSAVPPEPHESPRRQPSARTTKLVVAGAAVVLAVVFVLLITSPPNDEAKPVSLGFSLNSLFRWMGNLNPLAQIPIIIVIFGLVIALILVLIEYAPRAGNFYFWLRLAACFVIPVLALMLLRPYQNALIWVLVIALVVGALLFFADYRSRQGAGYLFQLVTFMAPAALLLALGLIYPTVATIYQSFFDKTTTEFVGLENYFWVFTNPEGFWSVVNTLIWVLVAPVFSTMIGLAYAVFIDKARGEKYLKSLVFMPMAISFVGAGIIWKFIYDNRQGEQVGLLNAIVTAFGGQPVSWLDAQPLINTLLLLVVFIWTQTGFAMVILSAAIKGVPTEQMEAAELDGTNAWQRFRNVTVPGIRGSLVVVVTTISIATLKVFDIVRTMTAGNFDTSVVANEMYTQAFRANEPGRGAALAVILFVLVLPIVIYNVRVLRSQKEVR